MCEIPLSSRFGESNAGIQNIMIRNAVRNDHQFQKNNARPIKSSNSKHFRDRAKSGGKNEFGSPNRIRRHIISTSRKYRAPPYLLPAAKSSKYWGMGRLTDRAPQPKLRPTATDTEPIHQREVRFPLSINWGNTDHGRSLLRKSRAPNGGIEVRATGIQAQRTATEPHGTCRISRWMDLRHKTHILFAVSPHFDLFAPHVFFRPTNIARFGRFETLRIGTRAR